VRAVQELEGGAAKHEEEAAIESAAPAAPGSVAQPGGVPAGVLDAKRAELDSLCKVYGVPDVRVDFTAKQRPKGGYDFVSCCPAARQAADAVPELRPPVLILANACRCRTTRCLGYVRCCAR
jgi:hypothetical protein